MKGLLVICLLLTGCAAQASAPRPTASNTTRATRAPDIGTPAVSYPAWYSPAMSTLGSVIIADRYGGGNRVGGSVFWTLTAYDQNGSALPAGSFTTSWTRGSGACVRFGPDLEGNDWAVYTALRVGTCTAMASVTAFGRTVVAGGSTTVGP